MLICLACLFRPGSWSVSICDDSILIPSGSLAFVSFEIMTGIIVVVIFLKGVYLYLSLQLLACFS